MAFSAPAHTATQTYTYVFQGYGKIQPKWVRECLQCFREEKVNISRLVLLQATEPASYAIFELHFQLPSGTPNLPSARYPKADPEHTFLLKFKQMIGKQSWDRQALTLKTS